MNKSNSHKGFYRKFFRNLAVGLATLLISLGIGMSGYHYLEKMSWIDAYENAAMILSGMGPVNPVVTTKGKLFAGTFALFSGTVFLVVIAFILMPVFHRFLHRFHMEEENKSKS